MDNESIKAIRLHVYENDRLVDTREEYDISDLAGTIPVVGDLIVSPWVDGGKDRREPENRTIYEVISRYFLPGAHGEDSYVAVVVKERKAFESERDVACLA